MSHFDPSQSTPIYQPNFNPLLSPKEMFKEPEKEKPKPKPLPKAELIYDDFAREAYEHMSEDEKNLKCAGIVLSANYRHFMKPYLESFKNPPRQPIRNDEAYYQLLEDNAIAAFVTRFIGELEGRAKRSKSFYHQNEEE